MNFAASSPATASSTTVSQSRQVVRKWPAKLSLGYQKKTQGTVLAKRRHMGPLCVQKPFYPEGPEVCHTYLLHPPAGIAGGDTLNIDVELKAGSSALITTPAATKFYRANPNSALLNQQIKVESGAHLEWLPQGNIFFDGTEASIHTKIELSAQSRAIAWDSQCLGRPACQETFSTGHYQQRFEIWLENQPLVIDRLGFDAGASIQSQKWGLAGKAVHSILAAYPADPEMLELINIHIDNSKHDSAATLLDGVLLVRCFGDELDSVHRNLIGYWKLIRPGILEREACIPRIWNT